MISYSFYHWQVISIHALRKEGDGIVDSVDRVSGISIHALRKEGDPWRR